MRRSIDDALDDHPVDDEFPAVSWMVGLNDGPEASEDGDPRVSVTLEERGDAARGVTAHLAPGTARRLRAAIAAALHEIGEPPGD